MKRSLDGARNFLTSKSGQRCRDPVAAPRRDGRFGLAARLQCRGAMWKRRLLTLPAALLMLALLGGAEGIDPTSSPASRRSSI